MYQLIFCTAKLRGYYFNRKYTDVQYIIMLSMKYIRTLFFTSRY